ncbi:MAG: hypothetical protein M1838_000323, partial [Thelocarpon superellum]
MAQGFSVHRLLLTRSSKFFASAFNGDFKEAQIKTLHLPEDDPEIFKKFLKWLYGQPLVNAAAIASTGLFETLAALYVFAEKVGL